jgi:hypothetical protein
MRRMVFLGLLVICGGCTTLRPIEGSPTELRQRINSGELLKAGDRVLIVTTDDKAHRFAVTGIESGLIEGRADSVPVDHVARLEKRQFSRGKTIALAAGLVVGAVFGFGIYAATHLSIAY